eukprot:2631779-Amphidinium_carterae.1
MSVKSVALCRRGRRIVGIPTGRISGSELLMFGIVLFPLGFLPCLIPVWIVCVFVELSLSLSVSLGRLSLSVGEVCALLHLGWVFGV